MATRGYIRLHGLTVEQESALSLLLTGMTDLQVATRLKLHRVTVTRWRLYDPVFRAELGRRSQAQWLSAQYGLRSVLASAVATVRDNVVNGDGRLALAFLQKSGAFGTAITGPTLADVGPTDLTAVLDEEIRLRRADGRLPMPAVLSVPSTATGDSSSNGTSSSARPSGTSPVAEPPITDEERDAVLAELLAQAAADAPLDLPLSDSTAATTEPPTAPAGPQTNGADPADHVVTSRMSSFN